MVSLVLRIAAALAALVIVTSCGAPAVAPAEPAPLGAATTAAAVSVIDVRTPAEYATGHLDGARLLDFSSGEFAAAIETLDPDAAYYLYCRSGNRAGQAQALMADAGFANVVNLGSVEQAAAALGKPVVSGTSS